MRLILTIFFMGLVVIISPVCILLTALRFSGINSEMMKAQLVNSNAYSILVDDLNKAVDASMQNGDESNQMRDLVPVVKKEITPALIQHKVEKLLDDTQAWLTGKSAIVPQLSFLEFKDFLIAQNPQMAGELGISSQKQVDNILPVNPEFDYGVPHPTQHSIVDTAINNKLTFQLGSVFPLLKPLYNLIWNIFYGVVIGSLLSLLFIFLLAPSKRLGIRRIGVVLILVVVWNIVPFLLLASPAFLISFITSHVEASSELLLPLLLKPILAHLAIREALILGVLFVSSLVFGIASLFSPL